jgi:hypothetical protein
VSVCHAVGARPILDANCLADIGAETELLATLHKAGARLFCVGFESGEVEVIHGMKKNNDDRSNAKCRTSSSAVARMPASWCMAASWSAI